MKNRILLLSLLFFISLFLLGCLSQSQPNETNFNATNETESDCNFEIVFIYADWCPHCSKMKPWVSELSNKYNITWVNIDKSEERNKAAKCLKGIAQLRYIPEFVCVSKKINKIGEFSSREEMENFFEGCKYG